MEKGDIVIETALRLKKTTRQTVVYESSAGDGPIRSLYIQQDGMAEPFPQRIQVTVTVTEA